jgi:carboxylesterase type B
MPEANSLFRRTVLLSPQDVSHNSEKKALKTARTLQLKSIRRDVVQSDPFKLTLDGKTEKPEDVLDPKELQVTQV